MIAELIGGPLDGEVLNSEKQLSIYVVVSSHVERPIYRLKYCSKNRTAPLPYHFLGYEDQLSMLQTVKTKCWLDDAMHIQPTI